MTEEEAERLEFILSKVIQEGLGQSIQYYFGGKLNSPDKDINKAWSKAHKALLDLEDLLKDKEKELEDLRAEGLI